MNKNDLPYVFSVFLCVTEDAAALQAHIILVTVVTRELIHHLMTLYGLLSLLPGEDGE